MKCYCKLSIPFLLLMTIAASAQPKKTYNLADLLKKQELATVHRSIRVMDDQQSVKLDSAWNEGLAWLQHVAFSNGTIDVDLKGKDVLQKSFIGIAFHGANDSTYDAIYFRPFNFKASDPIRKIHAVQYISSPTYDWKKLRDEHNGQYEKGLLSPPDPNGWFHARIVVEGKTITVFVNDDKKPSLTVEKLNDRSGGKLALWVGDGSDGEFKNLSITLK